MGTPISPTNEDVYSSPELRSNPQPAIQVFSPSRQHVGYPFLFAPANPSMYGMNPESDKFRKLMLKKQKRESRKPKNVLSEFKSEDISGHKFEDLDSVLQSLGEGGLQGVGRREHPHHHQPRLWGCFRRDEHSRDEREIQPWRNHKLCVIVLGQSEP